MKKIVFLFFLSTFLLNAANDKYRLVIRNNPATTATIGWNQISGDNPTLYYGTTDFGKNYTNYKNKQGVDRAIHFKGMHNNFVRLKNLKPNTAYYFVIKDSEGLSERFWFKTAPINKETISFIAGGDSRNNQIPRQNANKLVAKLKPTAVLFGGDMTGGDSDSEWQTWFDDWQLTIASDNRMFPIIAARGNHERDDRSIYNLFDTPSERVYFSIPFGKDFVRIYTLNSEIAIPGSQTNWLKNELKANKKDLWKIAQYHKPMRPHVSRKKEGHFHYQHWASIFYQHNVQLVVECDSHTVKSTWPIKPSTDEGSEEGFIRDSNGTVYVGEGCWGAPLRKNDDSKEWTRDSGSFNQFKWVFVSKDAITARTIKTDNADTVEELTNENQFEIPENLDIWSPPNGAIIEIRK